MFTWPAAERITRLADPAVRARMVEDAASVKGQGMALEFKVQFGELPRHRHAQRSEMQAIKGVSCATSHSSAAGTPLDALLDIVLADRLDTNLRSRAWW
jgi:hypothetical protein